MFVPHILETRVLKLGGQHSCVLSEDRSPPVSSHDLLSTMSSSLFIKNNNPINGLLATQPNPTLVSSQGSYLEISLHWGLEFQQMNFGVSIGYSILRSCILGNHLPEENNTSPFLLREESL